ncbi:hypothetical protein KDN32_04855 [Nocardioides sp. J2M5]|uniref:hypothetical protein n=1 Tax=Nocardioides palaemonis TaxID=2829810 RepID=UPI001BA4A3E6|nr:hypothetical protein [Nocardioides palaemonis]MBS2937071.1 hypothetical protein [Nocardioides palaemonis]
MIAHEEDVTALSIGAVYGGTSVVDDAWKPAVQRVMNAVMVRREGVRSPLSLNVVFHVEGELLPPIDFEGVRTGRLSRKRMELMVQAAVPSEPVEDRLAALLSLLQSAALEAEDLARRRKIADDLHEIRAIVDAVVQDL